MTTYALSQDYTVLLVEANSYHARITESMLRQCGIKLVIRTANSGEAMAMLFDNKFDLVVCDFDVPPDGGLELLRTIRNRNINKQYRVPVIVTCNAADIKAVTGARDSGATEFLSKPFSPKYMWRALYSALENGRPFVETEVYVGPDRRRKEKETPAERRAAKAKAAKAAEKAETAE